MQKRVICYWAMNYIRFKQIRLNSETMVYVSVLHEVRQVMKDTRAYDWIKPREFSESPHSAGYWSSCTVEY